MTQILAALVHVCQSCVFHVPQDGKGVNWCAGCRLQVYVWCLQCQIFHLPPLVRSSLDALPVRWRRSVQCRPVLSSVFLLCSFSGSTDQICVSSRLSFVMTTLVCRCGCVPPPIETCAEMSSPVSSKLDLCLCHGAFEKILHSIDAISTLKQSEHQNLKIQRLPCSNTTLSANGA